MKRSLVLLTGLMVVSSLVSAQEASAQTDRSYDITYYGGDPARGAEVISEETALANSAASRNEDLEGAKYVTVDYNDQRYTFGVASAGASRNAVYLDLIGQDLSLAEVLTKQSTNPNALEYYSR